MNTRTHQSLRSVGKLQLLWPRLASVRACTASVRACTASVRACTGSVRACTGSVRACTSSVQARTSSVGKHNRTSATRNEAQDLTEGVGDKAKTPIKRMLMKTRNHAWHARNQAVAGMCGCDEPATIKNPGEPLPCSAGFQPAVSPASSRQTPRLGGQFQTLQRVRLFRTGRIGNPRYSRLEVCATDAVPNGARRGGAR